MISYDWRRCPFPTLEPGPAIDGPLADDANWPYTEPIVNGAEPSGPMTTQGPMDIWGPLTSDLQRFWGGYMGDIPGLTGAGVSSSCIGLAVAAAGVAWVMSGGLGNLGGRKR